MPLPTTEESQRYHFSSISQRFASRIFSPVSVTIAGCLIAAGLAAVAADPGIVPGYDALVFRQHLTFMAIAVMAFTYTAVFAHEIAHLLAARAVGIPSRLGISHRLWVLVAETDLTRLWSVPRKQRYLPLLAGPLLDATAASLLLLLLFAVDHGMVVLGDLPYAFVRAITFTYLMALLWQSFLFVRTDFYFAIANFFGCKNLLKDTEAFLRNKARFVWPKFRRTEQAHLPAHEQRVIRVYAVGWVFGRLAAFASLFLITIPIMLAYASRVHLTVRGGFNGNEYAYLDALTMTLVVVLPMASGFFLWFRSLHRSWRAAA